MTPRAAALAPLLLAACAGGDGRPEAGTRAPREWNWRAVRLRVRAVEVAIPLAERWGRSSMERAGLSLRISADPDPVEAVARGRADLGIAEAPPDPERLEAEGLLAVPVVLMGLAPVANVPEAAGAELLLSREALGAALAGELARWDDPRLARLNPDLPLAARDLVVVHRTGPSAADWAARAVLGVPAEVGVPAEGPEQLAAFVGRFRDTLALAALPNARRHGLAVTALLDPAGRRVRPDPATLRAAAAEARAVEVGGRALLVEPSPASDWPLLAALYAVVPDEPRRARTTRAVRVLLRLAWSDAAPAAADLGFLPPPPEVRERALLLLAEHWEETAGAGDTSP